MDFTNLGMTPQELADRYLGQYKVKANEINAKNCPFCGPNEKRDNQWKFFLNTEEGTYKCHRENRCGASGSFIDLLKHFGEYDGGYIPMKKSKPKNKYPQFDIETYDVTDKIKEYFNKRGISEETILEHNVKTAKQNGKEVIAFEYFKEGHNVAVKYRNFGKGEDKRYWQENGGIAVLWELDEADTNKPLIITEGETDKLALNEAGFDNVTSVPFGSNNFKWVDNNWDKLEKFNEIIVCPDNDEAGEKFMKQAVKKLGEERTKVAIPEYPDINHQLYKEGKKSLVDLIKDAEYYGDDNLLKMSEIEFYDPSNINSASSSIGLINKYIRGYREGEISIWTGTNGSGKSTLLLQEAVKAVDDGMNTVIINGENIPAKTKKILGLQIADVEHIEAKVDQFGELEHYLPQDIRKSIEEWLGNRLMIYDNFSGLQDEKITKTIEIAVRRYGAKNIIVDNLMKIDYNATYQEKYNKQAKFVNKMKDYAQKYNCHIHIVAHPRKPRGTIVTKEDVAGLYEITNLADNVLCVHRITNEQIRKALKIQNQDANGAVEIFKNRTYGKQDIRIQLIFEEAAQRFWYPENDYEMSISWEFKED